MWRALGHHDSVHLEPWPKYDPELTRDETVTLVVQVNGKVRDRVEVEAGIDAPEMERLALASTRVQEHLHGQPPTKVVVRPNPHEAGRAHVIVYNWDRRQSVPADLAPRLRGRARLTDLE